MANTLFETPVTNDAGVKPMQPVHRDALAERGRLARRIVQFFAPQKLETAVSTDSRPRCSDRAEATPVRCASALVAGQSKPTLRPWAQPTALASAHIDGERIRCERCCASSDSSALHAEGVDHAVERRDEGAAVRDRQAAVVAPARSRCRCSKAHVPSARRARRAWRAADLGIRGRRRHC